MALFRRVLRIFFLLVGFLVGLATAVAVFFARRIIAPPRERLWASPGDLGLDFESVQFPARDGIRLSGWFIPNGEKKRDGATAVLVHGWPWNRLGTTAEDPVSSLEGASPVDILRLALSLHRDGYHVLMFDLRNHGESADAPPVTFGWQEANDLLGALSYLQTRPDVDPSRVGVVGFSMGANTVLYALPQTESIKAAVAVQPTSVATFARRYGQDLLGPLSLLVVPLAEMFYQIAGGMRFQAIQPAFAAASAGSTPVLFVQGEGDQWGLVADVAQMTAVTPQADQPLLVESTDRFGGYQYVVDNPHIVLDFFNENL